MMRCPKHLTLPSRNLPIHRCRRPWDPRTKLYIISFPPAFAGRPPTAARPSWHRIPATSAFCLPWPLLRWVSLPRGQNNAICPHLNSRHWQHQQRLKAPNLAQKKTLHKKTTWTLQRSFDQCASCRSGGKKKTTSECVASKKRLRKAGRNDWRGEQRVS